MIWESFLSSLNLIWLVVFIWLSIITILLILAVKRYRGLTKGVESGSLDKIIQKLIIDQEKNQKDFAAAKKELSQLQEKTQFHFQKKALVRYNPFNQTGGNQSFSLALLDGKNNGIVISSFHSREGTRLYAKTVVAGKVDNSFSKEEKSAIKEAAKK
ncbi:MAG: hypothetical protein XD98_0308 [Microgenomates bacterium 39_6]|nr:MAG: hypothetical protein XD98_0308 [Microgenomates bacterium 39_6]